MTPQTPKGAGQKGAAPKASTTSARSALADEIVAKALAELSQADSTGGVEWIAWTGQPVADLMLLKGDPGDADLSGGALSGADGGAAEKALAALGLGEVEVMRTVTRASGATQSAVIARLGLQVEAVDPIAIVALDAVAAKDLAGALGVALRRFGNLIDIDGRRVLAVDGLEASLHDEAQKARVWRQFKALAAAGLAEVSSS